MDRHRPPPANRRRFVRVPLAARVVLSSPTVEELVAGPLHDISLGGLFIKTSAQRAIGTRISIRIAVPGEEVTLQLAGTVVRAVSVEESRRSELPAGLGVQFTAMDELTQATLQRLVDAALRARAESSTPAPR